MPNTNKTKEDKKNKKEATDKPAKKVVVAKKITPKTPVKKTTVRKVAAKKGVPAPEIIVETPVVVAETPAAMIAEDSMMPLDVIEGLDQAEALIADADVTATGKPKYFETLGRRKTSTARIRLFTQGTKEVLVNGMPYEQYFKTEALRREVVAPMQKINCLGKFGVSLIVKGGGVSGQAEACRHAVARALVLLNPYFKKRLKKSGYLTRDPRMRERKKPGLKRARRAPQWSKR